MASVRTRKPFHYSYVPIATYDAPCADNGGLLVRHGNCPPEVLKSELTIDELKTIIDEVKFYGPNITFFGGEPLLYKEWATLVRYIKEAGLRCNTRFRRDIRQGISGTKSDLLPHTKFFNIILSFLTLT